MLLNLVLLKEVSYVHQGCIYLVKYSSEILLQFKLTVFFFYLLTYFYILIYSCDGKAELSASLLQSKVLHDLWSF